jgi:release factor glutamine methyltransferase
MSASSTRSAVVARLRAAGCVFAEDEARVLISAAREPAELAAMVEQRAAGRPLEHVVGWAEFCGLRIAVDPGVFVPRRRSELLVRLAAEAVSGRDGAGTVPVVVDLCCGSGAVGAALAATVRRVELHAVDIDPVAVACARRNLAAAAAVVFQGDLYEPLPSALRGQVDVLVAVTPYVPTEEIPLLPSEARSYEPRTALDGGTDGLDVLRRVIVEAPSWLGPHGVVLVEAGAHQASAAAGIVSHAGLIPRVVSADEPAATVVLGAMPAAPS